MCNVVIIATQNTFICDYIFPKSVTKQRVERAYICEVKKT